MADCLHVARGFGGLRLCSVILLCFSYNLQLQLNVMFKISNKLIQVFYVHVYFNKGQIVTKQVVVFSQFYYKVLEINAK